MSWQAYVDQSLVGGGNIDKAAIFDSEGQGVWAASPGFQVSPQEMRAVVAAYKDKGDAAGVKKVQSSGINIANERYIVLRADERSIYGRKAKEGVIIVRTAKAILLAHYPEGTQPGSATNDVERLGDYLVSVGY